MDPQIETLRKFIESKDAEIESIQAAAAAQERVLAKGELDKIKLLQNEIEEAQEDLETRVKKHEQKQKLHARLPRKTDDLPADPDPAGAPPRPTLRPAQNQPGSLPAEVKSGTAGFLSIGAILMSVKAAAIATRTGEGTIDQRLKALAPSAFVNESNGADGGFAVPVDFRNEIMTRVMEEEYLPNRCDQATTTSNSLAMLMDESQPWDTATGIQAVWDGEADQIQPSKPQIKDRVCKLNRITAMVPVTMEAEEDAPALTALIRRQVPQKFRYKVNEAILFGTVVGMPAGLANSPAAVTVAKKSGQTADTVVPENIVNMWGRLDPASRRNAVWVTNTDVETQFPLMAFPGTSPSTPIYLPQNGLSASPYATLYGRPILNLENARALGDFGDLMLIDFRQYMVLTKQGANAIRQDTSIHVYFDFAMTAYRFILRIGGQPYWTSPKGRANSANTLSPFVILAERA